MEGVEVIRREQKGSCDDGTLVSCHTLCRKTSSHRHDVRVWVQSRLAEKRGKVASEVFLESIIIALDRGAFVRPRAREPGNEELAMREVTRERIDQRVS